MEVNPTESDQTRRNSNSDKTIRHARFRRSSGGSVICSSGISTATQMSSSQAQRSDLFGALCLNCPSDNKGSCGSCSVKSAMHASVDQSTVTITGGPSTTTRAAETLENDEGSVYNGRTALTKIFQKPSTTTAMSMPGAEELTVYNGQIGCSHFLSLQSGTNQYAITTSSSAGVRNENEAIFDESICRGGGLISFGKLPSSSASPSIHTAGAATNVREAIIQKRANTAMRSWHGDTSEDASNVGSEKAARFGSATVLASTSLPENSMQSSKESWDQAVLFQETGTSSRPSNSVRHKRRRTEGMSIRVRAMNSEESGLPPDGYKWWKYGQKDIKGFLYPRNYYKCKTLSDCDAKKHVMRVVDEPSVLDITYKGKHSHAPPLELNATMHATTSVSASAVADIIPGAVLAAPQKEPITAKSADFIEYL